MQHGFILAKHIYYSIHKILLQDQHYITSSKKNPKMKTLAIRIFLYRKYFLRNTSCGLNTIHILKHDWWTNHVVSMTATELLQIKTWR